jgi:hypothetical protein
MKNKQYPPRGGPPMVYRCRGIPGERSRKPRWNVPLRRIPRGRPEVRRRNTVFDFLFLIPYFLFSCFENKEHRISLPGLLTGNVKSGRKKPVQVHLKMSTARIDEDVGPPGNFLSPNLQGFGNLEGLMSSCKAREPAGHPPERICRSGSGIERVHACPTGRRDRTIVRIRDGTVLNPDSCWYHRETDLASRHPNVNRPVHPPEWEWYGGKKTEVRRRETEVRRRKSEVGFVKVSDFLFLISYFLLFIPPTLRLQTSDRRKQTKFSLINSTLTGLSTLSGLRMKQRLQTCQRAKHLTTSDLEIESMSNLKNLINEAGTFKRRPVLPHL